MKKITTIYALVIDPAKVIFYKPIVFASPTEEQIKVWKEYIMQIVFLNEEEAQEAITALSTIKMKPVEKVLRFIMALLTLGISILFFISTIK